MKKKLNNKLQINKTEIARLSEEMLNNLKGGETIRGCTYDTCQHICPTQYPTLCPTLINSCQVYSCVKTCITLVC